MSGLTGMCWDALGFLLLGLLSAVLVVRAGLDGAQQGPTRVLDWTGLGLGYGLRITVDLLHFYWIYMIVDFSQDWCWIDLGANLDLQAPWRKLC